MLAYSYSNSKSVADWVAYQYFGDWDGSRFGDATSLVVAENETLHAAVLFNYFAARNAFELSVAAKPGYTWLTRYTINLVMNYPLLEANASVVCAMAEVGSLSAKLWPRFIAPKCSDKTYGSAVVLPNFYGNGRDGVYVAMTRAQWLEHPYRYV